MSDSDEWEEFVSYITPIIIKHEATRFSEDSAEPEAEKVVAKLKEVYVKTSDNFRHPNGKFRALFSRVRRQFEKDPGVDVYSVLQEFKTRLRSYRSQSSESIGKKRRRDIHKLDAHISKLNRMIKRLEEQEVDFEELDSEISSYMHLDKLKRRLILSWKKRCSLANDSRSTGRPIEQKFSYSGSQYTGVNERVCKHINSRRGLNFPNYKDILNIIEAANKEDKLSLRSSEVEYEAKHVFKQVGASLQKLRQKDYRLCTGSHLTDRVFTESESLEESSFSADDPAIYSTDLKKQLQENKRLGETKMESLIEDFVKRQEVWVKDEVKSDEEEEQEGEACSYSEESDEEEKDESDVDDNDSVNGSDSSQSCASSKDESENESESSISKNIPTDEAITGMSQTELSDSDGKGKEEACEWKNGRDDTDNEGGEDEAGMREETSGRKESMTAIVEEKEVTRLDVGDDTSIRKETAEVDTGKNEKGGEKDTEVRHEASVETTDVGGNVGDIEVQGATGNEPSNDTIHCSMEKYVDKESTVCGASYCSELEIVSEELMKVKNCTVIENSFIGSAFGSAHRSELCVSKKKRPSEDDDDELQILSVQVPPTKKSNKNLIVGSGFPEFASTSQSFLGPGSNNLTFSRAYRHTDGTIATQRSTIKKLLTVDEVYPEVIELD